MGITFTEFRSRCRGSYLYCNFPAIKNPPKKYVEPIIHLIFNSDRILSGKFWTEGNSPNLNHIYNQYLEFGQRLFSINSYREKSPTLDGLYLNYLLPSKNWTGSERIQFLFVFDTRGSKSFWIPERIQFLFHSSHNREK